MGSLVHPTPLDGLIYGFLGPDAHTLAAVHIPATALEVSAAYNVLDDAAAIRLGLEGLPVNQVYHPYINVGTPKHDELCLQVLGSSPYRVTCAAIQGPSIWHLPESAL